MKRQHPDVIVIGAGVIGLFTAWELSNAGLQVLLLERGEVGREASWAGGGILSPLHPWRYPDAVLALSRWSQATYPEISRQLLEKTGIDPEWTPSGLLILESHSVAAALAWGRTQSTAVEVLAATEQARRFAGTAVDKEAILLPAVAQVRNPRLIKALSEVLHLQGVRLQTQTPVASIIVEHGRVSGVQTAGGLLSAGSVVIAAGAWSGGIAPTALPVRPVKGEMLLYAPARERLPVMVLRDDVYLVPRRDGRVLVGSSVEECGFDKTPTANVRDRLKRQAEALWPPLAKAGIEAHWAGLRPGSPDGVPFICGYPRIDSLFVNTGHFRHGLLTAPASARLLADLLLGRKPVIEPDRYALR